jgi:hypothetical protein
MKTISTAINAQLEAEQFVYCYTVEIRFGAGTVYYTDADRAVHYSDIRYSPIPISFADIAYAAALSVDQVTVEFGNANLTMSAYLLGEDARNRTIIISHAVLNSAGTCLGLTNLFQGIIGEWEITEDRATIRALNELVLWRKRPLRTASATCPWVFKGTECGYAGAGAWCDQSFSRCAELANQANFGGFRFLPALMEKQVWWGRVPR